MSEPEKLVESRGAGSEEENESVRSTHKMKAMKSGTLLDEGHVIGLEHLLELMPQFPGIVRSETH